jgi:hypothetical protein
MRETASDRTTAMKWVAPNLRKHCEALYALHTITGHCVFRHAHHTYSTRVEGLGRATRRSPYIQTPKSYVPSGGKRLNGTVARVVLNMIGACISPNPHSKLVLSNNGEWRGCVGASAHATHDLSISGPAKMHSLLIVGSPGGFQTAEETMRTKRNFPHSPCSPTCRTADLHTQDSSPPRKRRWRRSL